jgi:hypothetical protein
MMPISRYYPCNYLEGLKKKHENPQTRQSDSQPRFKLGTAKLQVRRVAI